MSDESIRTILARISVNLDNATTEIQSLRKQSGNTLDRIADVKQLLGERIAKLETKVEGITAGDTKAAKKAAWQVSGSVVGGGGGLLVLYEIIKFLLGK